MVNFNDTAEPPRNWNCPSMPFSLGIHYAVVDIDYDIKGSFACLKKAQKFALAGELVVRCRLQPLEVCENPYDTQLIRKKP